MSRQEFLGTGVPKSTEGEDRTSKRMTTAVRVAPPPRRCNAKGLRVNNSVESWLLWMSLAARLEGGKMLYVVDEPRTSGQAEVAPAAHDDG